MGNLDSTIVNVILVGPIYVDFPYSKCHFGWADLRGFSINKCAVDTGL